MPHQSAGELQLFWPCHTCFKGSASHATWHRNDPGGPASALHSRQQVRWARLGPSTMRPLCRRVARTVPGARGAQRSQRRSADAHLSGLPQPGAVSRRPASQLVLLTVTLSVHPIVLMLLSLPADVVQKHMLTLSLDQVPTALHKASGTAMGFFRSRTQRYSTSDTLVDVLCLDYLGPDVNEDTLKRLLIKAGIRGLQVRIILFCTVTASCKCWGSGRLV